MILWIGKFMLDGMIHRFSSTVKTGKWFVTLSINKKFNFVENAMKRERFVVWVREAL